MQSLTRPNGSTTSYQYDLLNRLTEISNKNSSAEVLNQHVFTYNNWDFRDSETFSGSALPPMSSLQGGTKEYEYNTVNQLLNTINPSQAFVYDADGNMTQGSTPDGYVFTAEYDAEDRMTSLEYTDSSSVVHRTEYAYSGDGFLASIQKKENGSLVDEIRIVRDGLLTVQERDGSNAVVREYTWGLNLGGGIGGLLNLKQGGQDYAYLYDGKGDVEAILDASQAVVAAYRYDPFGKLLAKTGSLDQPFGFSTKRYDEQTGLIHYQYRPYAPAIGRWTTRDPLGEASGINLYAFVSNNPVNWVDSWGLAKKCEIKLMLVTAYCITGPGTDWPYYKPKRKGAKPGSVGPGTVAVANTKPPAYPFGSTVAVYQVAGITNDGAFVLEIDYKGEAHDTGSGWDPEHHNVSPDRWIDIWISPCKDANKWGKQWRLVKICYDDTVCPVKSTSGD